MEQRTKRDNVKIIAAMACLLAGFVFMWNIAAHTSHIYELRLDTATCTQVKTLGLAPSANCVVAAPYQPLVIAPGGFLTLPDGNDIQIVPVVANQTNRSVAWSASMKIQLWIALLFWLATMGLLLSVYKNTNRRSIITQSDNHTDGASP